MPNKKYTVTLVRTVEELATVTVEAPNNGHAAFLAGHQHASGVEWQRKSEKLDVTYIGTEGV